MRPQERQECEWHSGNKSDHSNDCEHIVPDVLVVLGVAAHGRISAQEARAVVEVPTREGLEDDLADRDVEHVNEEESGARRVFCHKRDAPALAEPAHDACGDADTGDAAGDGERGAETAEVVLLNYAAERRPRIQVQAHVCERPDHDIVEFLRPANVC